MTYKIKLEGKEYPVKYYPKILIEGTEEKKYHVIQYSNIELIGQSLEEVVNACKEKILGHGNNWRTKRWNY